MGWLVAIVVIGVLVWFLFNFPKQTLGCLGAIIVGLVILYEVYIGQPQAEREAAEARVQVGVVYDPQACSGDDPLLVTASNHSNKVVERIEFRIDIFKPGFSTDYAGYENEYTLDKILQPGEGWKSCFTLPPSFRNPGMSEGMLEYRLRPYKSVSFR